MSNIKNEKTVKCIPTQLVYHKICDIDAVRQDGQTLPCIQSEQLIVILSNKY